MNSKVLTQGIFDWDRAIRGFLSSRRAGNCSAETLRFYEGCLDRFRRWLAGVRPGCGPLEVRTADLREFLESRSGPFGPHRHFRTLRAFYRWLETELGGLLEGWTNPVSGLKAPRLPQTLPNVLTSEEAARLLEAARRTRTAERDVAILCVLLDKGLRAGELLGLTLADWDWATGSLLIRRGKGGKMRQVVLHPEANRALKAYVFKARPESASDRLFLTEEGNPLTYGGLRALLNRLGQQAGIRVHAHAFRHTFALHWVTAGGSLHELQALLGHSSPAMSLRYGRLVSDRVDPDRQAAFSPLANLRKGRESGRGSTPRRG